MITLTVGWYTATIPLWHEASSIWKHLYCIINCGIYQCIIWLVAFIVFISYPWSCHSRLPQSILCRTASRADSEVIWSDFQQQLLAECEEWYKMFLWQWEINWCTASMSVLTEMTTVSECYCTCKRYMGHKGQKSCYSRQVWFPLDPTNKKGINLT